jgi:hypothetical protein
VTEDEFKNYEDDNKPEHVVPDIEDVVDSRGRLLDQQLAYDIMLINAEVQMQLGKEFVTGIVKQ